MDRIEGGCSACAGLGLLYKAERRSTEQAACPCTSVASAHAFRGEARHPRSKLRAFMAHTPDPSSSLCFSLSASPSAQSISFKLAWPLLPALWTIRGPVLWPACLSKSVNWGLLQAVSLLKRTR
jgi:hypothetical protein